jgi:hypothetical protein
LHSKIQTLGIPGREAQGFELASLAEEVGFESLSSDVISLQRVTPFIIYYCTTFAQYLFWLFSLDFIQNIFKIFIIGHGSGIVFVTGR